MANPIVYATVAAGDTTQEPLTFDGTNDLTFSGGVTLSQTAFLCGLRVNNSNTVMSGAMTGLGGLFKTGPGTLKISGDNSFSGRTVVAGGTLLVNNASGSGTGTGNITVNAGATLGGSGTISGSVTNDGTLSPGASIGALTITGSLALNAGGTTMMELNAATGTNDQIRGLSSVSYGGTLQLNNVAGALTNNATFQLFNSASYGGSFANINPATPGPGQTWNTNNLTVNGTISVAGNQSQQPITISNVTRLGDGSVQFSFSGAAGQAYRVWASTNVMLTPITSTWTPLTNATFGSGANTFRDLQATNFPLRFYVITVP